MWSRKHETVASLTVVTTRKHAQDMVKIPWADSPVVAGRWIQKQTRPVGVSVAEEEVNT